MRVYWLYNLFNLKFKDYMMKKEERRPIWKIN